MDESMTMKPKKQVHYFAKLKKKRVDMKIFKDKDIEFKIGKTFIQKNYHS